MLDANLILNFVHVIEAVIANDLDDIKTQWEEGLEHDLQDYRQSDEEVSELMEQIFALFIDMIKNAGEDDIDDYREQIDEVLNNLITIASMNSDDV